jgi:indole-3-glycerol phosphate synthase
MRASLDSIVAATRQRLLQRASAQVSDSRRNSDRQALERAAAAHTPRGFRNQLRRVAQDGIAIIAELKKPHRQKA